MNKKSIIAFGTILIITTGALIPILTSCSKQKPKPLMIAHRGAPGKDGTNYTFENNLESFNSISVDDGFYGIETDVYLTSDGKWVVCHDDNPFLASDSDYNTRSSNDYIYEKDLDYCLNTPIVTSGGRPDGNNGHYTFPTYVTPTASSGTGAHYMCTFEDYLQVCKDKDKYAIIEIKEPDSLCSSYSNGTRNDWGYLCAYNEDTNQSYLEDLYQKIVDNDMIDKCIIISFFEQYIRLLKNEHSELNDNHQLQVLVGRHLNTPKDHWNESSPIKDLIDEGFDVSVGDEYTAWLTTAEYGDTFKTTPIPENRFISPINKSDIDYAHQHDRKFGVW